MRFVFQFVPIRFAFLSCAFYLALISALAIVAAFVNVGIFKNWGFSASRGAWLVLNAGVSSLLLRWLGACFTHAISDNWRYIAIAQVTGTRQDDECIACSRQQCLNRYSLVT